MYTSTFKLGRYSRLALLLLMLAAQGLAVAHTISDGHGLQSHPCSTCIIGHGLGAAVSGSYDASPLQVYQAFDPAPSITATLASRSDWHLARAPPGAPWNTQNPN
jgi:hypothetical protein